MTQIRTTQHLSLEFARQQMARHAARMLQAQQQISSGLRIQRPSDDPSGVRRSLIQLDRLQRLDSQQTSINQVQAQLNASHVQLTEVNNLLVKARDLALQAPQTINDTERRILASELDGILTGLKSAANASDETGYLFSGTAAHTMPFPDIFSSTGQNTYQGTSDSTQLHLNGDVSRSALQAGDTVFQPVDRQPTLVIGTTGAAAGSGTDTATGNGKLLVSHVLTTYSGTSGVAAGTGSVSGDTVIGAAGVHSLQIADTSGTGASGTISLNGGPPVAFTSADTNLQVTGPEGEVVYVQTTSITPGYSGSVSLTATGSLSIDGGTTTVPITFGTNQLLTSSQDGSVVYIDSTNIRRAGTDKLEFPGTADVFAAVRNLRDDILNNRNLAPDQYQAAINRRLGDIARVQDHILDVLGVQSVSMEQFDRLLQRTGDLHLAEQQEYSDTTSADISATVIQLQESQNLQQFTMAALGRYLTPNLLNFLQ